MESDSGRLGRCDLIDSSDLPNGRRSRQGRSSLRLDMTPRELTSRRRTGKADRLRDWAIETCLESVTAEDTAIRGTAKGFPEGTEHEDRDAQFERIARRVERSDLNRGGRSVQLSMDTKSQRTLGKQANRKVERIGCRANRSELSTPTTFAIKDDGEAIPHGDLRHRRAIWGVGQSVGLSRTTRAEFAVEAIRCVVGTESGSSRCTDATEATSDRLADGGGSNAAIETRSVEVPDLQRAQPKRTGVDDTEACRLPAWDKLEWNNPIERRLFRHIAGRTGSGVSA